MNFIQFLRQMGGDYAWPICTLAYTVIGHCHWSCYYMHNLQTETSNYYPDKTRRSSSVEVNCSGVAGAIYNRLHRRQSSVHSNWESRSFRPALMALFRVSYASEVKGACSPLTSSRLGAGQFFSFD